MRVIHALLLLHLCSCLLLSLCSICLLQLWIWVGGDWSWIHRGWIWVGVSCSILEGGVVVQKLLAVCQPIWGWWGLCVLRA